MNRRKGNGLDAANDQPVKTLKHTADFIARVASFATADSGYLALCAVVLLQAALLALGVLQ
jgi:hypothetical protein